MSDQELEVEEVVEGTGMVGGTYRLLATGPSSLTSYITDVESGEEVSDIEVSIFKILYVFFTYNISLAYTNLYIGFQILDQSYEEIDIDVTKPVKLDLSMTENYTSKLMIIVSI